MYFVVVFCNNLVVLMIAFVFVFFSHYFVTSSRYVMCDVAIRLLQPDCFTYTLVLCSCGDLTRYVKTLNTSNVMSLRVRTTRTSIITSLTSITLLFHQKVQQRAIIHFVLIVNKIYKLLKCHHVSTNCL